eukprot:gene2539-biopygen23043
MCELRELATPCRWEDKPVSNTNRVPSVFRTRSATLLPGVTTVVRALLQVRAQRIKSQTKQAHVPRGGAAWDQEEVRVMRGEPEHVHLPVPGALEPGRRRRRILGIPGERVFFRRGWPVCVRGGLDMVQCLFGKTPIPIFPRGAAPPSPPCTMTSVSGTALQGDHGTSGGPAAQPSPKVPACASTARPPAARGPVWVKRRGPHPFPSNAIVRPAAAPRPRERHASGALRVPVPDDAVAVEHAAVAGGDGVRHQPQGLGEAPEKQEPEKKWEGSGKLKPC